MLSVLQERFECRDEGLYWKFNRTNPRLEGRRAGRVRRDGYRYIKIDGKEYQEHRLVLMMNNVEIPEGEVVHHIDCDKTNNSISNLVVWTDEFHRGWHNAQKRNPLCVKFKVGGLYSPKYLTGISQPSGSIRGYHRGRPKLELTDEQIAERKEKAREYRKAYYAKNRERMIQQSLDSYYRRKAVF